MKDEKENVVKELEKKMGIWSVGWIFKDLVDDDVKKGNVKNVRKIGSKLL
jgi:hypothetical protein